MSEALPPVTSSFSRRRFFGWTSSVAAALGAAPLISSAGALGSEDGEDYYDKLGVAKIINAAGTYTTMAIYTWVCFVVYQFNKQCNSILMYARIAQQ